MSGNQFKRVGEGRIGTSGRKIRRERRSVKSSRFRRKANLVVAVVLGGISFAALIAVVGLNVFKREAPVSDEVEGLENAVAGQEGGSGVSSEERADLIEEGKERLETAKQLVREFVVARSSEEFLKLVRDPERVRPQVEAYVREYGGETLAKRNFYREESPKFNGYRGTMLSASGPRFVYVDYAKFPLKVDWEAFNGTLGCSLEELKAAALSEQGAMVRVKCRWKKDAGYYNFGYEERDWIVFDLDRNDFDRKLHAYLSRKDALVTGFEEAGFFPGKGAAKASTAQVASKHMIVHIRCKDAKAWEHGQVELIGVPSWSWYYSDSPCLRDSNQSQASANRE